MQTSEERRNVAENLRYAGQYGGCQYKEQFYEMLVEIIEPCGLRSYSETFDRLADLVDPEKEGVCSMECTHPVCEQMALTESAILLPNLLKNAHSVSDSSLRKASTRFLEAVDAMEVKR